MVPTPTRGGASVPWKSSAAYDRVKGLGHRRRTRDVIPADLERLLRNRRLDLSDIHIVLEESDRQAVACGRVKQVISLQDTGKVFAASITHCRSSSGMGSQTATRAITTTSYRGSRRGQRLLPRDRQSRRRQPVGGVGQGSSRGKTNRVSGSAGSKLRRFVDADEMPQSSFAESLHVRGVPRRHANAQLGLSLGDPIGGRWADLRRVDEQHVVQAGAGHGRTLPVRGHSKARFRRFAPPRWCQTSCPTERTLTPRCAGSSFRLLRCVIWPRRGGLGARLRGAPPHSAERAWTARAAHWSADDPARRPALGIRRAQAGYAQG